MKKLLKETELAELVIAWLSVQNWEIYQEVQFSQMGGIADIVAVRQNIIWIIETKTSMSIQVLNQASSWPAHFRSVAVPLAISRNGNNGRDYRVAQDYYRVGVIEVGETDIWEAVKPPLYLTHHKQSKRMISQLTDLHKTFAKAGSRGGGHLTPYKQTMIEVRRCVEKFPGCTIQDIFEKHGSMHYASKSSFKGNLLKCLDAYERDWCKIDTSSKPYKLYLIKDAPPIYKYTMMDFVKGE